MSEAGASEGVGRVRGVYMRMLLQALDRVDEAHRGDVLERMRGVEEAVSAAPRMGWVPFELNYEMTRILDEELGRAGMMNHFRRAFLNVWSSSLLRALTEFVLRLTGKDIQAAARNFGRGFTQLFRELGTFEVLESERGRVLVEYVDFPDRLLDDGNLWLYSVVGSLTSLFDYAELEGQVELVLVDQSEGRNRAHYLLTYGSPSVR